MLSEMRNIIREEVQNSLASMSQREVYSPGPARKRPRKDPEQEVQDGSSEAESEYRGSDQEEGELPVEEQEGKRYYFPVEETEELVQAVRRTMQVKEDPQPRSRQDQMFGGLTYQERTVFPVSEHIRKMISQEWKDAERRLVMSREFKNRLPFDSEEIKTWEEIPKWGSHRPLCVLQVMPRVSVSKTRGDKSRTVTVAPLPPVTVDIIPGRFTEDDWMSMVTAEDGEHVVGDIVDSLISHVMEECLTFYLQQQVIPYTISQARDAMLQIVQWTFVPRDEGNHKPDTESTWQEEPQPCPHDSWAQGCVPVTQPAQNTPIQSFSDIPQARLY
ncbi:unnamed protein product [Ranitomeya imitator]|uniref:Uncharacterized protein n=1 Tax=Ranitomeya imitator TaxID=111125 RepID=A0ABN9L5Z4_9NEOB|nr:unnamed protein product [Ranitomeya imitator]